MKAHALLVAVAIVASLRAQQTPAGTRLVSVRVVSVTADSVYLDHGRDLGIVLGDRVVLFPPGGGDLEVVVRAVTHSSARCEPPPGVPVPPVGTLGEATVPIDEAAQPDAGRAAASVPEHPPWTREPEVRSDEQPLLVPAFSRRPEEREALLSGRAFGIGQWNRDASGGNEYLLLRSGLRADASNVFGHAERTRFAGEWSRRMVMIDGREDEVDDTGRVDLASVAFGTEHYAPVGVEVGRFLSPHLPELGLVDGVEAVLRFEGGVRVGGGAGAYPRPFPARNSGDDVGVHAFVDYVADDRRSLAVAFGVQKTWHRGAPDRDLVMLRGEWRPDEHWTLLGNAKVDFYTGRDTIETRVVELTEALLQLRWQARDFGAGLVGSHFGWPELRRAEFQFLSPELVRDGAVDRLSLNGWWRPATWCHVALRGDHFADQARDGTSLRADARLSDVFGRGSALALSAFRSDGSYTSGPGASASLRHRLFGARLRLAYRWHRYTLESLVTGPETRVRESLLFGCSCSLDERTELDISAEHWFGDVDDAFAVGAFMQWRF